MIGKVGKVSGQWWLNRKDARPRREISQSGRGFLATTLRRKEEIHADLSVTINNK